MASPYDTRSAHPFDDPGSAFGAHDTRARNFEASLLTLAYGGIETPNEFFLSRSIRPTPHLR
jgi:hypothetical protein